MTADFDSLVRAALADLAQEARTVELTERALRQARRRRTTVMVGAAAGLTATALVVTPLAFGAGGQSPGRPQACASAGGSGPSGTWPPTTSPTAAANPSDQPRLSPSGTPASPSRVGPPPSGTSAPRSGSAAPPSGSPGQRSPSGTPRSPSGQPPVKSPGSPPPPSHVPGLDPSTFANPTYSPGAPVQSPSWPNGLTPPAGRPSAIPSPERSGDGCVPA